MDASKDKLLKRIGAVRDLARQARHLGGILGEDVQQQLREFAQELDSYALQLEATGIAAKVLPAAPAPEPKAQITAGRRNVISMLAKSGTGVPEAGRRESQ